MVGPDDGLWVERKELAAMKAQVGSLGAHWAYLLVVDKGVARGDGRVTGTSGGVDREQAGGASVGVGGTRCREVVVCVEDGWCSRSGRRWWRSR